MAYKDTWEEKCANCGKAFEQTQLGALSDAILRRRPICSFECNVALGQIQPRKDRSNERDSG